MLCNHHRDGHRQQVQSIFYRNTLLVYTFFGSTVTLYFFFPRGRVGGYLRSANRLLSRAPARCDCSRFKASQPLIISPYVPVILYYCLPGRLLCCAYYSPSQLHWVPLSTSNLIHKNMLVKNSTRYIRTF